MNVRERQTALARAREGDDSALGQLLESFRPYVRVIVRALRDGQVAARLDDSDLIQEAMLEANRAFANFRGQTVAELAVWLRRVAVRSAGRSLRVQLATGKRDPGREQPVESIAELLADPGSSPSDVLIRQERAERITTILAQLPEDMQSILLYRHVDCLPHAAIAERLGRGEGAVRVLYVRALERFRELYLHGSSHG
jgi:RNA polymerase sigma-70 factor (ECF subfamily)